MAAYMHPAFLEFDMLINQILGEFIQASKVFGEPLASVADMVKEAFMREREVISVGINSPRPPMSEHSHIFNPLISAIRDIQDFRNRNRQCQEYFNHLSVISESIDALKWISVKPAPIQYIRDMIESGEYFGNRVLSSNKGDPRHMAWVNKWREVLRGLEQYVKEHHLTGFSWGAAIRQKNTFTLTAVPRPQTFHPDPLAGGDDRHALLNELNQGVDIVRMLRPVRLDNPAPRAPAPVPRAPAPEPTGIAPVPRAPAPEPTGIAPVPRAPAPEPSAIAPEPRAPAPEPSGIAPVPAPAPSGIAPVPYAPASASSGIAPVPRAPAPAPSDVAPVPRAPAPAPSDVAPVPRPPAPVPLGPAPSTSGQVSQPSGSAQVPRGASRRIEPPPKFLLEGRKWRVEYQKNHLGMVIDSEDMSESVAMFSCEKSSLDIRTKKNGIVIDNCKRTNVALHDIISAVELIRCDRIQVQCNGHVPLMNIDNSESVQLFLTEASRDIEIISSKSSSCNVCLLEADGTFVELPMPEQIKTVVEDGRIRSTVVEKN